MARITLGEFGYTIPLEGRNEIGQMAQAFNKLSRRVDANARLTRRIDEARSRDEMMRFVFAEFRPLLPGDWVGLLSLSEVGDSLQLERCHAECASCQAMGKQFAASGALPERAYRSGQPLHIADLAAEGRRNPAAHFATARAQDGYGSALFFPLGDASRGERRRSALLVFASRTPAAYRPDHIEPLQNIATQISRRVAKAVLTESLVISAVSGLAKLAESRDSATGDHLIRMAHYAALVAEQLDREGSYAGRLPPERVGDIHRFAPMQTSARWGARTPSCSSRAALTRRNGPAWSSIR